MKSCSPPRPGAATKSPGRHRSPGRGIVVTRVNSNHTNANAISNNNTSSSSAMQGASMLGNIAAAQNQNAGTKAENSTNDKSVDNNTSASATALNTMASST